jgi:aldehyde:ferredoxin oxidoreductase
VRTAANTIGHDTIKFAMQVKGLEFPGYDPRAAFGAGLTYAVCPRGACHRRAWPPAREVLGTYLPYTALSKAEMVKDLYDENCVYHSMLVCDSPSKFLPLKPADYVDMLNMATGLSMTDKEALEIADKAETLIRMFNVREGFSRKDDTLPDRILYEAQPTGPSKGQIIGKENLDYMLSEYYSLRGWDDNGDPKPETIAKYGL